uniref:legumain n=1 Tax=Ditylenchus dipsaci TaxID=166011 RepID=A0A915EV22_9BILA
MISKFFCHAILIGVFVSACHAIYQQDGKRHEAHKKWVLLAASSKDWSNYRHQADVCHAYHLVKSHGIPEENIITMMYDDIAHNENNPYPGKIFNAPLDRGCYLQKFLAILSGNASGVTGGNGRVIKSTNQDKIFVYLADHGSPGFVSFPTDELTAKKLSDTLHQMHNNKQYSKLTFYLEACEAGSMFQGKILPADFEVFAMTASNPEEPSYGCYCEDHKIGTCVGDLFSVNWMADSEKHNTNSETIKDQYETVKITQTLVVVGVMYHQIDILKKKHEHLDCHHELVHAFSRDCFSFGKNPYALKYGKVLANFCEMGLETDSLVASLKEHCADLDNDIEDIV